jgi:transposase
LGYIKKNEGACEEIFLQAAFSAALFSPDLNPIEKFWTFMKAKIKKIADGIKSLSVCGETFF